MVPFIRKLEKEIHHVHPGVALTFLRIDIVRNLQSLIGNRKRNLPLAYFTLQYITWEKGQNSTMNVIPISRISIQYVNGLFSLSKK